VLVDDAEVHPQMRGHGLRPESVDRDDEIARRARVTRDGLRQRRVARGHRRRELGAELRQRPEPVPELLRQGFREQLHFLLQETGTSHSHRAALT